jgi:hypothetical protein
MGLGVLAMEIEIHRTSKFLTSPSSRWTNVGGLPLESIQCIFLTLSWLSFFEREPCRKRADRVPIPFDTVCNMAGLGPDAQRTPSSNQTPLSAQWLVRCSIPSLTSTAT